MKRTMITLMLLAVMFAGVFAPNTAPRAAAQEEDGLLIWADATRTPILQEVAARFSEEYGIPVTVQEVGMGNIRSDLQVAGPAGTGPDIIIAAHDWIGELVLNGAVVPINLGSLEDQFTEESLDLFTYGGELYGMPYAVENVAFFRNTDLVPEAPETWDEVFAITEELVSSGASDYGYIIQDNDPYHTHPILSAFGGYIFGVDENGDYNPQDVGLDSEGAIAAGEWFNQMAEAGYLITEVDYDVMHTLFESGQAAMMVSGPWALERIRESGVPYAISDLPAGPAGPGVPFIGGQGFMISAFSENQLLAEAFLLDYMADMEPMQALYEVGDRPPAYIPLLETIENADLVAFQQAGEVGIPQPSIPEMASVWGAWGAAFQFIISGELEPEEALAQSADVIRRLIAGEDVAIPGQEEPPVVEGPLVVLPGTFQAQLGCGADWDPACVNTQLAATPSGLFVGTFDLEAGDYEYKVAVGGTWDENYGVDGEPGGANITLSLAEPTSVTFIFDPATGLLLNSVASLIVTAPGSYQAAAGCPNDWAPECLLSLLTDPDGDGVYTLTLNTLPAGDYEVKAAVNMTWDVNYGVDGEPDGANIPFTVGADNAEVTFSFDSTTNVLTVAVAE